LDDTGPQKEIPLFDIKDRKGKDNEGSVEICHVDGVADLTTLPIFDNRNLWKSRLRQVFPKP